MEVQDDFHGMEKLEQVIEVDVLDITESIDITSYLFDFLNENDNENDSKQVTVRKDTADCDRLGSLLTQKKRRKLPHYSLLFSMAQIHNLQPRFSVEEDLTVRDLLRRQQNLRLIIEIKSQQLMPAEYRKQYYDNFVECMNENRKIDSEPSWMDEGKIIERTVELFATESAKELEELRNLNKVNSHKTLVKTAPSIMAFQFAVIVYGHSGDGFLDQMEAMAPGYCMTMLKETDKDISSVMKWKNLKLEDCDDFTSPWAESFDLEVFVESTLKELGGLLGRDTKLAAIFQLLLMISPPGSSPKSKKLRDLQSQVSEMMYRYLSSTRGPETAGELAYSLVGFLDRVHRAGDIMLFRRIKL